MKTNNFFIVREDEKGGMGKAINFDQVVDVDFYPGGSTMEPDEDTLELVKVDRKAKATITTTAMKSVTIESFDGPAVGGAMESKIVYLYGEDAWSFWWQLRGIKQEEE